MTHLVNGIECRTREESLKHIIKQAKAKKIGAGPGDPIGECMYLYESGNNCAVGSLFSKAQLQTIKDKWCNDLYIGVLANTPIKRKNVETVTGMKLKELDTLQRIHDDNSDNPKDARKALIQHCQNELKKLPKSAQKHT